MEPIHTTPPGTTKRIPERRVGRGLDPTKAVLLPLPVLKDSGRRPVRESKTKRAIWEDELERVVGRLEGADAAAIVLAGGLLSTLPTEVTPTSFSRCLRGASRDLPGYDPSRLCAWLERQRLATVLALCDAGARAWRSSLETGASLLEVARDVGLVRSIVYRPE